ncbi:unnamed protein product [Cuscuta campestris]|uniref:Uncharacterized protein n=1 Tax=Cuscuta campestris TaxID=132261 RepID=A0A484KLA3_9ASTE|nr:unnamed protein product [Cuscuta campestris]
MKLASLHSIQNAHDDSIWTAAWVGPNDGARPLLLTGGLDETVRLWDPERYTSVRTNTGHCLGVVSVATHPTRRIAASASIDSFIRVFDVDSNLTIATLEAPPSEVWQLSFNPEGSALAAAGGGSLSIKLWDTAQWQHIIDLSIPRPETSKSSSEKSGTKKFVLSVAWSPDGRLIACGSMDGTISVFDVPRGKFLHFLEGHCMPVRSLAFSPSLHDSRLLFSASDDGHVHMYDAQGKALIMPLSGHSSWVLSVDVSPDGGAIATGSSDKSVRLWDLKMRAATQILTTHTDQVWAVAFGPSEKTDRGSCMLTSVSDDKSIALYLYS